MTLFPSITRRRFLESMRHLAIATLAGGAGLLAPRAHAADSVDESESVPSVSSGGPYARPRIATSLLEESPFVYISPLLANGQESSCHGEVWYAWLDESIVVNVAGDRWKATALARGLDTARVWIGDHGRWRGWFGNRNEDFRSAPHFDARVERIDDASTLDRLLAIYEDKYPEEIASWRDSMRNGIADGSRVLLRYRLTA